MMQPPILLQEHDRIKNITQDERFEHLSLVSWEKPMDNMPWGYYASYKISRIYHFENYAIFTKFYYIVMVSKKDIDIFGFV